MISRSEVEELWAQYVEQAPLSEQDEARLAEAAAADQSLLYELALDQKMQRRLRATCRGTSEREPFEARVLRYLELDRDGERFTKLVAANMDRRRRVRRAAQLGALAIAAGVALWLAARPPRSVAPPSEAPRRAPVFAERAGAREGTEPARAAGPAGLKGGLPQAAGGGALGADAAATSRAPVTLFAYDFEDGVLPPEFQRGQGYVVPAPPGSPSRFCLLGTLKLPWKGTRIVGLSAADELFRYNANQVVTFDYRVGPDTKRLWVQFKNLEKQQNYRVELRNLAREGWGRAVVRLADAQPVLDASRAIELGDPVGDLYIQALGSGGGVKQPVFVDNLRLDEQIDARAIRP